MSQRPRTTSLRGPADKIPARNVATAPRSRSAGSSRQNPRVGCRHAPARLLRGRFATHPTTRRTSAPAHPRIPTTCREEPRRPAPQARADLRPKQRVSNWEDTSAAPGATLAPGGEWAERESPYRQLQFSSNGNTQKYYNWEETRDKSTPDRPQAWSLCQ